MKISLIGTGRIGFLLEKDQLRYKPCTHMGAVEYYISKKKSGLQWDFLCDLDEERLNLARKFADSKKNKNLPLITKNYKEVIQNKPDILIISTDTFTHYDIIMEAIKSKIGRIVIEKPLTLNSNQALKIYNTSINNKTHIWVNYERRYHPKYITLKNTIASGNKYGKAIFFKGWFASPNKELYKTNQSNEGILLHDTTHLLDLVQFLFGEIEKKTWEKNIQSKQTEAHSIGLSCSSGISGEILTTAGNNFFHLELEIIFEKARVVAGNGFLSVEHMQTSRHYKNFKSLSQPVIFTDKNFKAKENPFIKLYGDVISDNFSSGYLKDACDNIKLLS
jgi:predicted dehydrogenase